MDKEERETNDNPVDSSGADSSNPSVTVTIQDEDLRFVENFLYREEERKMIEKHNKTGGNECEIYDDEAELFWGDASGGGKELNWNFFTVSLDEYLSNQNYPRPHTISSPNANLSFSDEGKREFERQGKQRKNHSNSNVKVSLERKSSMNHKDGDQTSDSTSALTSSLTLDQLLKTGVARSELSLQRGVVTK